MNPHITQFDVPIERWSRHLLKSLRHNLRTRSNDTRDLLEWGRQYLPHHFSRPPSKMHRWLAAQLGQLHDGRGTKLNVIGPRGSAKSTVVTLACVLRAALAGNEPYIWIVSDTRHQALVHLENLRSELAENQLLRRDHPHIGQQTKSSQGHVLRLGSGVTIEAYGTGQRLRGKRRKQHRPSLIVCDDLQNDDHISSAWQRQRSRSWFEGTLLKAGTKRTNVLHLATALHRDALGMVLSRSPGWISRTFKAIERWPVNMQLWHAWEQLYTNLDDPHRLAAAQLFYQSHLAELHAGAELLWPEEEDLLTLMQMRVEAGHVAFEREKQGSPFDPSACEWPEAYFDEPLWFTDWPTRLQVRTLALDPSKGSDSRRGDYSAYVWLGLDESGTWYVDADIRRRPTPDMVADGVERVRQFQPDAFGVESNQFQHLLAGEFTTALAAAGLPHVSPWLIDNHISKPVRIRRLGPLLAAHRLRFKANSPGAALLVEQLRDFPLGDFDDGPDALEMALRLANELMQPLPSDGLGERLPVG